MASNMAQPTATGQTAIPVNPLAQNASTQFIALPHHIIPLSTKARLLTRYLLDGIPLPTFLAPLGDFFTGMFSGVLMTAGLAYFLTQHQNDRAKIQLAVFHIVRMLDNAPNYRQLRPRDVVAGMEKEVQRMVGEHLSFSEAEEVRRVGRRKIEEDLGRERARRRRIGELRREHDGANEMRGRVGGGRVRARRSVVPVEESDEEEEAGVRELLREVQEEERREDVQVQDEEELQLQNEDEQEGEEEGEEEDEEGEISMMDDKSSTYSSSSSSDDDNPYAPSSAQPRSSQRYSTYKGLFSSESVGGPSSPTPDPRQRPQASQAGSGYGLDYEDDKLYSSPEPLAGTPPTEQPQRPITLKKPTTLLKEATQRVALLQAATPRASFLEDATRRAFDPNAPGNRPYQSPVLSRLPVPNRPTNSMALGEQDPEKGTWLTSIAGGLSPQDSPPMGSTEYGTAASRKLYGVVITERKKRRSIRDFFGRAVANEQALETVREELEVNEEVLGEGNAMVEDEMADEDHNMVEENLNFMGQESCRELSDPIMDYWENENDGSPSDPLLAHLSDFPVETVIELHSSISRHSVGSSPSGDEISPVLPPPPSDSPETSSQDFLPLPSSQSNDPYTPEVASPPLPSLPSSRPNDPYTPEIVSPALPVLPSSSLSSPPHFSPPEDTQPPPETPPPVDITAETVTSSPAQPSKPAPSSSSSSPSSSSNTIRSHPIVLIPYSPPQPATTPLPKKKPGRPRKVVGKNDTPRPVVAVRKNTRESNTPAKLREITPAAKKVPVQTPVKKKVVPGSHEETPGLRKSARKNKYVGAFSK
jgi:hypothetical protein